MANMTNDENDKRDSADFDRRFKYAVIVYAVMEFVVIALIVYYTSFR